MQLICFSHLRWNFVYQRPQHLLSRFAKKFTTYYIEEHVFSNESDGYTMELTIEGVHVVIPHLFQVVKNKEEESERITDIFTSLFAEHEIKEYIFWYYTPMAYTYARHFKPELVIYDCMDELSAFKFAPPELTQLEKQLLQRSQIVFTGGQSLFNVKKRLHPQVYCCPSSIDKMHFGNARSSKTDPIDQQEIPHPRLGFYGVIDERFDIELIRNVAKEKPDWHFVLIGPVVKINPAILPSSPNIHYLGAKTYEKLPSYLSGWDIALIPFALNESTRFISPTKTPEYLAAGRQVISTAIADVVNPYGMLGLVQIIDSPSLFIEKANNILETTDHIDWLSDVDKYLRKVSWDDTWNMMYHIISINLHRKHHSHTLKQNTYV